MNFQAATARAIMALPEPIISAMAGGPFRREGMTLDPRIALMRKQAQLRPPVSAFSPPVARQGMKMAFAMIDAPRRSRVAVRDLTVPGPAEPLEARLYTPPNARGDEPLIVYFHQGGCVLGGLWTCDTWCSILSEDAGVVVLNVDYRHAPEHKFPAAVEDAIAAFRWGQANAASLGANPERVGVGGDSAGGYLSAVICQAQKREGLKQPVLQLLIYPCTDWTARDGTMETMADAYPLNADMMQWFVDHYLAPGDDPADWRISPALAPDKTGLAPALIYTAGFDPLTSQAKTYGDMLAAAGVKKRYRNYPTLAHSFTAMSGVVPAARKALADIAADVKQALSE